MEVISENPHGAEYQNQFAGDYALYTAYEDGKKAQLEDCERQVEITWDKAFKAGKREGIREVVDFCKQNSISPYCHDYRVVGTMRQEDEHRKDCRLCRWQAKLKEWGVEKDEGRK